jgi:hypothetical protein
MPYYKGVKSDFDLSHLLVGLAGVALGASVANGQIEETKKSRAERDNPDDVLDVCKKVVSALEEWEPDEYETEDDFVSDLATYLNEETGFEIEEHPDTREGQPDILVEDCLAIEVKISLRKSERDRCVGQCAAYSREWVTWIVVIDAAASVTGDLENLLADKRLEHIRVFPFD